MDPVLVGGSIVDMGGVARAKYVPTARLDAFRDVGMGASPSWSVFTVDGSIAFTGDLGVVGDLRIRIDPDDLRDVGERIVWAPGDLHHQDGSVSRMCARGVLRRVVAAAAEDGLTARVGGELECTLLSPDGGHATGPGWAPYGLRSSLEQRAFLVDLTEAAQAAGLVVEQVHMEYGHDQLEVSLAPTDPVSAADQVVLARLVVGRAAERHGMRVSFSPVPFAGEAGNGAHLHLSLDTVDGPAFSGGDGPHGLTQTGSAALAGVLEHLPGLLGVYAGSVLSERRLQPGNWAGAALCWGLENREAAVRLVQGGSGGANIELKVVDPSANPYLAVAGLLGSAHRGVMDRARLPDEVGRNPAEAEVAPLTAVHEETLDALERSSFAGQLLGAEVVAGVLAVRRHEVTTYAGRPLAETAEALRFAWSC